MAVSLADLIAGDSKSLDHLEKCLEEDGWLFVKLDKETRSLLSQAAPELLGFFNDTPNHVKFNFTENIVGGVQTDGPVYGYNSDPPRKEGLRLLTNTRLSSHWLPPSCSSLPHLSHTLHSTLFSLLSSVSFRLFGCKVEEIGEKWDVPMLRREGHPKARGGGGGEGRFAMMDVAYYYNSKSFNLPNCLKHSDPGLLSLSVLSTHAGLQLQRRRTGEWVDAPVGVGQEMAVLWGGILLKTITNGRLKSGVHRVLNNPTSSPRLSLWIECITERQDLALTAPLLKDQPTMGLVRGSEEKNDLDEVVSLSHASGIPISKRAFSPPRGRSGGNNGGSALDSMVSNSKSSGVPMSKSGLPPRSISGGNPGSALDSLVSNSKSSGVPMSKSGLPIKRGSPIKPVQPTRLPKTPLPHRPGEFKKNCTPQQFEEMKQHTQECSNPRCFVVWNGMWGPFIGGRDGDVNFSLSECSRGRWMNEVIGWDYTNPPC